jgi:hypothetical protein
MGVMVSYPSADRGYYPGQSSYPDFGKDSARRSRFGGSDNAQLAHRLLAAVVVLGAATYLFSFGPVLDGHAAAGWFVRFGVAAAVLAALTLLRERSAALTAVATLSVLGFLDALAAVLTGGGVDAGPHSSTGWALVAVAVLDALQAAAAVAALVMWPKDSAAGASEESYRAYLEYYQQATQQYYADQYTAPPAEATQRAGYADAAGYGASTARQTRRSSQEADYGDFAAGAPPRQYRAEDRGRAVPQPGPVAASGSHTPAAGMPRMGPSSQLRPQSPDDGAADSAQ